VVSPQYIPDSGHIIKIDMDPSAGHEHGGWRPAVVLSPRAYTAKSDLLIAVPVTNQVKGYPFEVRLPPEMKTTGVVLADQIKSLDWRARRGKFVETAPTAVLEAIHERVALLLRFSP
jgi:mRNA interferase MazF